MMESTSDQAPEPTAREPAPQAAAPEGEEPPPRGARVMAIVRWSLVALMAVVAATSVIYAFGLMPREAGESSVTQYYCPMHPQIVQDHPGDCPICNMTLVPRGKETMHDGHGSEMAEGASPDAAPVPGLMPVQLSFDRTQLIGVKTEPATKERLASELRSFGTVAVDEARVARVHTRFSGWIERLVVGTTGQWVERGAPLALLFNRDLLPAQQEFLAAKHWNAARDSAPQNAAGTNALSLPLVQDGRTRLELLGMSDAEIDAIAASGVPTRTLTVVSPLAGHVVRKSAVQGAYVEPGMELYEIADLSRVWVLADVYEAEIGRVNLGVAARVVATAYPEREFKGKVAFIYPELNQQTRTLRVRVELQNPGMKLRPGMYGEVFIALGEAEGVAIPVSALIDTGELQYVFVAKAEGRFEPRLVKVRAPRGGKVPVVSGLSEGELVVTTANFMIDSESRLRAAIEGAPSASGAGVSACDQDFDERRYPDKHTQCRECERVHRGMGTMEDDCKNAIPKPWR